MLKSFFKIIFITTILPLFIVIFTAFYKTPNSYAANLTTCVAQDPFTVPDSSVQTITFIYKYTSSTVPPTSNPIPITIQLFKNSVAQGPSETIDLTYKGLIAGEVVYNGIKSLTFAMTDVADYAYYFNNTSTPLSGGCAWKVVRGGTFGSPKAYWSTAPAAAGLCPAFVDFNPIGIRIPNEFTQDTDINLLFTPILGKNASDYKLKIIGKPDIFILTGIISPFGAFWNGHLGKVAPGQSSYDVQLFSDPNVMPVETTLCGTAHFFISSPTSSPPPAQGPAGSNPCSGGQCCTAFGCISTSIKKFSESILSLAIGLAGGIALILMVRGSISILTSGGDPQKVNAGREVIIAAVAGLLFLIFSVLILRFIGIHLLTGIPGIS